jgi:predicted Zn-dependent protease
VLALGALPAFVPSDSEWIERARPHLRSDPARAIEILEDLRATKPSGPVADVASVFIAIAKGDEEAARAALSSLVTRRPDLVVVLAEDEELERLLD